MNVKTTKKTDIQTQTEGADQPSVPPPDRANRPSCGQTLPHMPNMIGKSADRRDTALAAVDACCEKTFWLLENFIQGRLQKTNDQQNARGCQCLELETRSAMTDAKKWVGRLSARYSLSLRDQLKTCHRAIQYTLLAWEAVFRRSQLTSCEKSVQCALSTPEELANLSLPPAVTSARQSERGQASPEQALLGASHEAPWDSMKGYKTMKGLFEGKG